MFVWKDGSFQKLVDATDLIPGSDSVMVGSFTNAFFQNGRVVFLSVLNQDYRILEYSDGALKTLVSPEIALPETGESFLGNLLDFDGSNLLFRSQQGLYQIDAEGNISLIAKKGDPLGDSTITFFGGTAFTPEGIATLAQDEAFQYRLAIKTNNGFEVLVSKGDPVSDTVSVGFLSGNRISVVGSDIIVDALLGSARGLLAYNSEGLNPILASRKLDGEAHTNMRLLGASDQYVFVTTEYSNGNSFFYANSGESVDENGGPTTNAPELNYSLTDQGSLRFTVPEGFQLQKKRTIIDTRWDPVEGQGTIEIQTDDVSGFFRLNQP